MREQLTELRDWLASWSGKLATLAAAISALLAAVPADAAFAALGFLPEGPARLGIAGLLFVVVWLLPKVAAKKDGAGGE